VFTLLSDQTMGPPKKSTSRPFAAQPKRRKTVSRPSTVEEGELEEDSTALSRNVPIQKAAEENDMSFSIVLPFTCRMEFF